jgi:cobalt/nickel transport protein
MNKPLLAVGAVALAVAAFASPYASDAPDGLERTAHDLAFGDRATDGVAPLADYALPGVDDERIATGGAGAVGALLAFGAAVGVGALLKRT